MTGAFAGRDGHEVEALVTDRYLESLLAAPRPRRRPRPGRSPSRRRPRSPPTGWRATCRGSTRRSGSRRRSPPGSPRSPHGCACRPRPAAKALVVPFRRRRPARPDVGDDRPAATAVRVRPAAAHRRRADLGGPLARRRGLRRVAPAAARRATRWPAPPARSPGRGSLMPLKLPSFRARRDVYPADLWTKCPILRGDAVQQAARQGPARLPDLRPPFPAVGRGAARAARSIAGTWDERDAGLQSVDPLGFVDQKPYPDRLAAAQTATGHARRGGLGARPRSAAPRSRSCVMDFGFMGGSMGAVVGEKVTRAAEYALAERIPLVVVSASGGARMQEGTLALMQLAKTLAALERLRDGGVPFMSVLSRPDDRRGVRLVRRGRRRQPRRTERADRLRRGARVGRDDRPGAAAGLPALRVPVRAMASSTGSCRAPSCAPS